MVLAGSLKFTVVQLQVKGEQTFFNGVNIFDILQRRPELSLDYCSKRYCGATDKDITDFFETQVCVTAHSDAAYECQPIIGVGGTFHSFGPVAQ